MRDALARYAKIIALACRFFLNASATYEHIFNVSVAYADLTFASAICNVDIMLACRASET